METEETTELSVAEGQPDPGGEAVGEPKVSEADIEAYAVSLLNSRGYDVKPAGAKARYDPEPQRPDPVVPGTDIPLDMLAPGIAWDDMAEGEQAAVRTAWNMAKAMAKKSEAAAERMAAPATRAVAIGRVCKGLTAAEQDLAHTVIGEIESEYGVVFGQNMTDKEVRNFQDMVRGRSLRIPGSPKPSQEPPPDAASGRATQQELAAIKAAKDRFGVDWDVARARKFLAGQ